MTPSKIPRLCGSTLPRHYGTPRRVRLDHAYTQSNLRTVGTQTEPMHPPVATLAPRSSPPQSTSRPTTPQPSSDEPAPSSESDVEPLPSFDYEPVSASTSESIESDEDEDSHRNKYIVFEASLDELMKFCCRCGSPVLTRSRFTTATMGPIVWGAMQDMTICGGRSQSSAGRHSATCCCRRPFYFQALAIRR